ncbi:MAG: sarcosine oxidase subunit delta [Rhodobacteraceae bacterium]|nr:sarcosine oxidase subunit delta [Paracoccaceae bacterium]
MLLIPCPNCGPRDETEFTYGGPVSQWPEMNGGSTTKDWHRAVHFKSSKSTLVSELWYHDAGCERWIVLCRDQNSHDFTARAGP